MKKFCIQRKGIVLRVVFKTFNEKAIKCILSVEHQTGIFKGFYTFIGYSYCNYSEGDIYNEEYGKDLAYERAFEKYIKYFNRCKRVILKELDYITDFKI